MKKIEIIFFFYLPTLDEVVSEGRDDELIGELMNHVLDGGRLLSTVHLHPQILVHKMQIELFINQC
jgi:hypothetical protein